MQGGVGDGVAIVRVVPRIIGFGGLCSGTGVQSGEFLLDIRIVWGSVNRRNIEHIAVVVVVSVIVTNIIGSNERGIVRQ